MVNELLRTERIANTPPEYARIIGANVNAR